MKLVTTICGLLMTLVGCHGSNTHSPAKQAPAAPPEVVESTANATNGTVKSAAPDAGPPELPELSAPEPLVPLEVGGYLPAVLSLPLGARHARPVLVAAHGAGDRPEWQCEYWRRIIGNRAFIACPRGAAIYPHRRAENTGYYYRSHPTLGREISSMLKALRARYARYVDEREPAFAGYSQGASMGALLLANHPAGFARAVLIEGGYGGFQEWNIDVAQRWHHHGAQRVLMACGRFSCVQQARLTAYYFSRGGVASRILYAEGAGHTYGGDVENRVRKDFDWLVRDDARWFSSRPSPGRRHRRASSFRHRAASSP